jgi:hypothetical protein
MLWTNAFYVDAGVMNCVAAFVRTKFPTGKGLYTQRAPGSGNGEWRICREREGRATNG